MACGIDDSNGNYASLMSLRKETLQRRCSRENMPTTGKKHALASRLVKAYLKQNTPLDGTSADSVAGDLPDARAHEVDLALERRQLLSDHTNFPNSAVTDNGKATSASGR